MWETLPPVLLPVFQFSQIVSVVSRTGSSRTQAALRSNRIRNRCPRPKPMMLASTATGSIQACSPQPQWSAAALATAA